eukprot:250675_1
MGNTHKENGKGHSRRHTVHTMQQPITIPYIKHVSNQSSQQLTPNSNNLIKPTHPTGLTTAHSANFVDLGPNKMTRSISTPTLSEHYKITHATIDKAATTPKQHLITQSSPFAVAADAKPQQKKKSNRNRTSVFPFKQKQTKIRHHRFQSAIPYINFNDEDDKHRQTKNGKNGRNRKGKKPKSFIKNCRPKLTLRNAFSSNDEHSASLSIDNLSYHSDPAIKHDHFKKRKFGSNNKTSFNRHKFNEDISRINLGGNGVSDD